MTDIIFQYIVPDTNWLSSTWRRAKKKELYDIKQKANLELLREYFPNLSNKKLAEKIGMSYRHYLYLRRKHNLK